MGVFGSGLRAGQSVDVGGVTVNLRVNARARRISLRIDLATGQAIATAPRPADLDAALRFARSRRAWLAARLSARPADPLPLAGGQTLDILGEPWRLEPTGRRPRLQPPDAQGVRVLSGCGDAVVDPGLVTRAVKRAAKEAFEARIAAHCESLDAPPPPLGLIDARTRWGSCTPAQRGRPASIRLSWRLALAPFEVADYVVAHECAHLLEANHGPQFWALVDRLVGDPRPHRAWLRRHGAALHTRLGARDYAA